MLLELNQIQLKVYLGFFSWEQKRKRKIILNLKLKINEISQKENYTIQQTVDYDWLLQQIKNFLAERKFQLIEHLVINLADFLINIKTIEWLEIKCNKPNALNNFSSITASCQRSK